MTLDHDTTSTVPASAGAVLRRAREAGTTMWGLLQRGSQRTALSATQRLADSYEPAKPELNRMLGRPTRAHRSVALGTALTLIGVLLVGFAIQATLVSGFKHERDQATMYEEFRYRLADATAPVGQVDESGALHPLGTPVAMLTIPTLGITEVVTEGTTSRVTLSGPGHRRDTVLPGQRGVSVIMGRSGAYGGPFGSLASMRPGDTITTITGQGQFEYQVVGLRREGEPQPTEFGSAGARLTLVTADGPPFLPNGVLRVDAVLTGERAPTPVPVLRVGSLGPEEAALGSDSSALLPLLLLIELALIAVALTIVAMRRWGRWHAWIVAAPVMLWIGSALAEQVMILLPNLL